MAHQKVDQLVRNARRRVAPFTAEEAIAACKVVAAAQINEIFFIEDVCRSAKELHTAALGPSFCAILWSLSHYIPRFAH